MTKVVTMKGRKLRIVRKRTGAVFTNVYHERLEDIDKLAWRARIPGMDRDDVRSEMAYCLWVAWRKFDQTQCTDLGVYWWSVWLNHRANWIRSYNAQKRAAKELPFSHDELIAMAPLTYPGQLVEPPDDVDDNISHTAWAMLALGYLPGEVQEALGLSNRRYYTLIDSWKTSNVHDWLTNQYR